MKFSSREDINAPIDRVFEMLSDFDAFERNAMRRGSDVRRVDDQEEPGCGMAWNVEFEMRGKRRNLDITLTKYNRPDDMLYDFQSSGIEGYFSVDLVAMSRTRTRLAVALELKPKTLSARVLVQSLRLAKSNLNNRFKQRIADYAKDIEERHNSAVHLHY